MSSFTGFSSAMEFSFSRCGFRLGDLFVRGPEKADAFVDDVELDDLVFRGIAHDADWLAAVFNDVDLLFQELAEDDDALIAGAEIFQRAVGDRPLRLPGHRVLRRDGAQVEAAVGAFQLRILKRRTKLTRKT